MMERERLGERLARVADRSVQASRAILP